MAVDPLSRAPAEPASLAEPTRTGSVGEVFALFLRLGLTAFGGPAAHTAIMEDEVVRRRRWVSQGEFLDLVGATNLIPGPNSTELAIHLGRKRAGWPGFFAAGVAFISPAALLVTLMAWAYQRYGELPRVGGILWGVKPVILAVVLQALWGLGRSALKNRALMLLGAAAVILGFVGVHELAILFGSGLLAAFGYGARNWGAWDAGARRGLLAGVGVADASGVPTLSRTGTAAGLAGAAVGAGATGGMAFGLGPMFLIFLKIGAVLFGSGYVLLAFLRADLVDRLGWLSEAQLVDAIAAGQVTPGPLFAAATFIGYLLGGLAGAGVATVGIFLPAFVFVALSGPLVPRLRKSHLAGAVLDGVNVASLALMAVVTWHLAAGALRDPVAVLLAVTSALLLLRWRVNSVWLVLGGAVVGTWFH